MSRKEPTKYQKAFEEIDFITHLINHNVSDDYLYMDHEYNEDFHYIVDDYNEVHAFDLPYVITKEDIKQRKGYKDYFDVSNKSVKNRVNKLLRDSKEIDEIMEFIINISDENPKNNLITVSPIQYDYEDAEEIIFGGYDDGLMVKLLKKLDNVVDKKRNSHDFKSLIKNLEKVEKKFVSSHKKISQKEHEEFKDVLNRLMDPSIRETKGIDMKDLPSISPTEYNANTIDYIDEVLKKDYDWKNYPEIIYQIQLVLNKIKEKEKQRKALDAIFKKNKSVPDEMRNEINKFMGGRRTRKHKNSNKKNTRKNKK